MQCSLLEADGDGTILPGVPAERGEDFSLCQELSARES